MRPVGAARDAGTHTARRVQFTLRQLLFGTLLIAVIMALPRITGSPIASILCSVLLLARCMCRFAYADVWAVVVFWLGAEMLAWCGLAWAYLGRLDKPAFLSYGGSLLVLASAVMFLRMALARQPKDIWQIAHAGFVLLLLLIWWCFVPAFGDATIAAMRARVRTENNAAMNNAVAQVEAIREELGRVPRNDELADLLEKPLPSIQINGVAHPIEYNRESPDHYHLYFLVYWDAYDIYRYDSRSPRKGWVGGQIEP